MECTRAFLELALYMPETIKTCTKYMYIFIMNYSMTKFGFLKLTCQKLSTIGKTMKKASFAVPVIKLEIHNIRQTRP